ncbi:MAG: hypothetical protein HQL91_13640 [Magnetococcales bacterium]|nr:hypothetical protein [Magnetococcales bacterium]
MIISRMVSILLLVLLTFPALASTPERPVTNGEREILQELAALKAGQAAMNQRFEDINRHMQDNNLALNKRIEDVNQSLGKRIEDVNQSLGKRIEDINQSLGKRIEDINQSLSKRIDDLTKRVDDLTHMIVTLFGSLLGIITAFIGFILWDRRTMMKPFEEKLKANHEKLQENATLLDHLLLALRDLAREDQKLAAVLRNFSLM